MSILATSKLKPSKSKPSSKEAPKAAASNQAKNASSKASSKNAPKSSSKKGANGKLDAMTPIPLGHRLGEVQPNFPIEAVLDILDQTYDHHPMGEVTQHDPYRVLIGCLISLRTKDEVTIPACERLFALADTPTEMLKLTLPQIEQAIFPAGFFRNKAQTIHHVSEKVLENFDGNVPTEIDELLTLKGVGRKTANLVRGLGHGLPAICVDIHVHRICNRFGYLKTKDPEETEFTLREHLPLPYWTYINTLLVLHGQQICRPISPWCDACPVASSCQRVNVLPRKQK